MNMIHDNSEFHTTSVDELGTFLAEREKSSVWLSDETGCTASDVRFLPVYPEPLLVPSATERLRNSKLIDFEDGHQRQARLQASDEAYEDTICDAEHGYSGSSQMMYINGNLYPVGMSAVNGLSKRAGLALDGWEKLSEHDPRGLSSVLDTLMRSSSGNLTVLVQDEKVRAVNSGKYAACPYTTVLHALKEWAMSEYPDVKFVDAFLCHDFTVWHFDLSAYTQDILGSVPELVRLGFTPALTVSMSHIGTASVAYQPCLRLNGVTFPIGQDICAEHIAKGSFSERMEAMKHAVEKNLFSVFPKITEMSMAMNALQNVRVENAYNALLRGMKSLGLPKQQALEAAEEFYDMHQDDAATAFEIVVSIADVLAYVVRDFPQDYRKHVAVSTGMERAVARIDWKKLGELPGNFSW